MPIRRLYNHVARRAYVYTNGLDTIDCLVLAEMVGKLAPAWSTEPYRDPFGETSLMIIPPDADDALGPTLIISRTAAELHVDNFHWDTYAPIGRYSDLDAVVRAVRDILLSLPEISGGSRMLH